MRTRLTALIYVPLSLVLVLLGMLYLGSVTRAQQHEVHIDRQRDAHTLVITARRAILNDDPSIIVADLQRYHDVYGIGTAVLDQAGVPLAVVEMDIEDHDERHAALAGRQAEVRASAWPWQVDHIVVAEPIVDGADLIGALVTVSDADGVRRGVLQSWGVLVAGAVAVALFAVLIADRTAGWVLRPVQAVDHAIRRMGSGRLDERIPPSTGPPELRQVITRFNDMAERVEHLMRRQQEFVANASHELRNPLNALMLRIESLALSVPAENADDVEHVRAEGERMKQILDALLLLADDANMGSAEPVDVADVAARRVDGWRMLDADRQITFTADPPVAWALAREAALESALDTVLDNACKFSPADEPLAVTVTTGADMVEVAVRDHGPGVDPELLDRLAERFWRSPVHSSVRGSGLGLAIASELLAAAGGALRLELPEGGGLLVRLQVPAWDQEAR